MVAPLQTGDALLRVLVLGRCSLGAVVVGVAAEAQVLVVMPALIVAVQVAAMLVGKRLLVVCSWKTMLKFGYLATNKNIHLHILKLLITTSK